MPIVRVVGLFLSLAAATGLAQVQVDVRLDKTQYLAGEPIFVLVDVRNVGDESVGYSMCDSHATLTVAGSERRRLPSLSSCGVGFGSLGGCGDDHSRLLPGNTTTTRRLSTCNRILEAHAFHALVEA
jgi:hypothetical protein